ncbi:Serine/threonine-protein kinase AFC3 [Madurella mycetomatis]|uniref:non-specific serine/threonine protein kinase n=1 Tax=Madurella mycetomatis TaxID=100816 RepID=A0A175W7F6_9PEZI|nr:Serine/threonine-protein kinase AFC3 [Madurella mycetomatis]KXX79567.1 Serine/threonine-protein kinase AFC3 [Madurella mycetomatis]
MSHHEASPSPEEDDVEFRSNGLRLELAPFGLENIIEYERGGYHPVHLGDILDSCGRYRVLHKLGHGGYGTVWLCRNLISTERTQYVALKIIRADASEKDCPELLLSRLQFAVQEDKHADWSRFICFPLDQFKIEGPNGTHLCFVYPLLGPRVSYGAFRGSDNLDKILRDVCHKTAKAIAFLHTQGLCHGEPPEDLGIPGPYRSPGLILESAAGFPSDLWALGCTLFEIRTGRKLFSSFDDDDDEYLDGMSQILGELPEPWRSAASERVKNVYEEARDANAPDVGIQEAGKDQPSVSIIRGLVHLSVAQGACSLLDMLNPGLWYIDGPPRSGDFHRDIGTEEKQLFADLVGKLLSYRPEDRMDAKGALNHEWFKF